jgi:hypothetical protein
MSFSHFLTHSTVLLQKFRAFWILLTHRAVVSQTSLLFVHSKICCKNFKHLICGKTLDVSHFAHSPFYVNAKVLHISVHSQYSSTAIVLQYSYAAKLLTFPTLIYNYGLHSRCSWAAKAWSVSDFLTVWLNFGYFSLLFYPLTIQFCGNMLLVCHFLHSHTFWLHKFDGFLTSVHAQCSFAAKILGICHFCPLPFQLRRFSLLFALPEF